VLDLELEGSQNVKLRELKVRVAAVELVCGPAPAERGVVQGSVH
jgi:hypothetical protein